MSDHEEHELSAIANDDEGGEDIDWSARANGTFQDDAPDEACRCRRCGSYRPGYPYGPADPCLECRERDEVRAEDALAERDEAKAWKETE